ncbi:ABC transporter ATP-binding protein [Streptoalloteichus hindustanus]|uniref:Iron complex transport system ATP-binding protein n=1 Tax=Streptoalloteichus hindustanus TaxID=2017 RepID=A0A1M5CV36_STRHI|nr:ABC transporter ATP-binding protein [Streptoalloteichus hindustanus]SHF58282.1 iron complex transport system ATP-binding protein [Streptoalloteichus hindustanus]
MIEAKGVEVHFGQRVVLRGVDLEVAEGEWVALVGRNGCGKTTLLRVLAGLRRATGSVHIGGTPLESLSRREIARRVAVLPQAMPAVPALTVRQLVRQGRYAVRGPLGMLGGGEDAAVRNALRVTGTDAYADAQVDRLSGGERQRVRLALALAQAAPVLLLDEPTTYLDVRHQLEVLELVERLRGELGLTVVTVLHDLAQAARYADRVVALREGVIHADGRAADVVDTALLSDVFGVRGRVWRDEVTGRPLCVYDSVE